jgi:7,8-dihydropterin-6-yl-methyl-4-(beta-D-ribofuranosyl)aminobenzene 5'-phosphate synthase
MALKELEKLEVTCLIDNNVDVLLPNTQVAFRPTLGENWFERTLIAEHGFSVAIRLQAKNGTEHTLLFDSGLNPLSAAHNADVLGLDLYHSEMVISSHGHIDHAGGLLNIRKKMNTKQNIPLLLHEHAFKNRLVKFRDGRTINLPAPNRSILTRSGYSIVEINSPSLWMDDSVLVSGEVPRTNDFEKGFPNHYSEVEDGKMERDPLIRDDQAIVFNIKNKGLVVITGCGHSGIINILKYAKELTGEDIIYAVLGGMHLTGGIFESIIPRTIDELEKLKPKILIPCHCSGLKAINEIARNMPNAFIQNSVGTTYIF